MADRPHLFGHLGCFHYIANKNTALNIHEEVFVWMYVLILLGIFLGVELLSHVIFYLTF